MEKIEVVQMKLKGRQVFVIKKDNEIVFETRNNSFASNRLVMKKASQLKLKELKDSRRG